VVTVNMDQVERLVRDHAGQNVVRRTQMNLESPWKLSVQVLKARNNVAMIVQVNKCNVAFWIGQQHQEARVPCVESDLEDSVSRRRQAAYVELLRVGRV
jgi:hypothetical protein